MSPEDWRAGASREVLLQRAQMLARIRDFFAQRQVLEVDTPTVVQHAVTDVQLHSAEVHWPGLAATHFLHTSPEYAMKRLLASGSGDIYQICHVFRGDEQGPQHSREFTLIEWYRLGFGMVELMHEVDQLLRAAASRSRLGAVVYLRYDEALRQHAGCDPLTDSDAVIAERAERLGLDRALLQRLGRDQLLDLLMGAHIGPQLGHGAPCFVHRYPASQAALARLDPADSRVALRFELYLDGMELANGFEELIDVGEQRARFDADRAARRALGLAEHAIDVRLLAALAAGVPACSGVALGFDRLMMHASGVRDIRRVQAIAPDQA
jgi:lysyl-tRNA synthetase class 2